MNKFVHHKYLHEIFEDISEAENRAAAAERLKMYNKTLPPRDAMALRDVIKGALDPKIIWRLPTDIPNYRPCDEYNMPTNIMRETTKFRYLVDGTRESMDQPVKREKMYYGILESVHPKDAEIVVSMVRKDTPIGGYKHLTKEMVRQAFGDNFFEEDRIAKKKEAHVKVEAA